MAYFNAEDHIADETRYACLARAPPARPPAPVGWSAL
jgi:hypothetical protein